MPFDPSVVSAIRVRPVPALGILRVTWTTAEPSWTVFHVYANRVRSWVGTGTACDLPYPGRRTRIDVGAVLASEESADFGADLDPLDGAEARVTLTWAGGAYLKPAGTVAGYNVYGEESPGGGIDYNARLAFVPAALGPDDLGGFGHGGFGDGGFGSAQVTYTWTSDPLDESGEWFFGVKAVDDGGNESTALETSAVVAVAPRPPAPYSDGARLRYAYDDDTGIATLTWQASG